MEPIRILVSLATSGVCYRELILLISFLIDSRIGYSIAAPSMSSVEKDSLIGWGLFAVRNIGAHVQKL